MKKISMSVLGFMFLMVTVMGCGVTNPVTVQPSSSGSTNVIGGLSNSGQNDKIVTFFVIGKGLEPESALTKGEAVLLAERAAVADGYRQLVEKIRGVYVDAFMRAGRGTVDYETIQLHTQAWLRGTEVQEIFTGEHGIVNARMQLRINFTKQGMVWWPVGISERG